MSRYAHQVLALVLTSGKALPRADCRLRLRFATCVCRLALGLLLYTNTAAQPASLRLDHEWAHDGIDHDSCDGSRTLLPRYVNMAATSEIQQLALASRLVGRWFKTNLFGKPALSGGAA